MSEEYEVEAILDKKITRKSIFYLVKWKNFDDSYNSWEPIENLSNCKDLYEEYDISHKTNLVENIQGSFDRNDKVKRISQILYDDINQVVLGEVEWEDESLFHTLYPVQELHKYCPREMCEMYKKLLILEYKPSS
ncbi:unnamed protein product [Blepharisma stoltei]|uniref:Chromo domain-containing protein n=1 Tax=Blepharisma stoltei TaxID=1481888 RepID=A0AAU9KDV3_9CILI|nr:unnamed protein product [Blepharisma stoltei]